MPNRSSIRLYANIFFSSFYCIQSFTPVFRVGRCPQPLEDTYLDLADLCCYTTIDTLETYSHLSHGSVLPGRIPGRNMLLRNFQDHQDIVLRNHSEAVVTVAVSNGVTTAGSNGVTDDQLDLDTPVPVHPLGVKPLGNQYLSSTVNARRALGQLQTLPDEVLSQLLEYFDQQSLRKLGYTCRFLFAFCHSDEFWKPLFLE